MSKINPHFLATGLIFLICGYAYAGGSIEFLGNFSGGNVGAPVVFTGDNASGTGTVRIRPSDEDTQLVICEASNNASPEVCSSWQHYNSSTTSSASFYATNLYVDSAGATQVYASAFGSGYFQTAGTTTAGVTYFGVRHPSAAANTANYVLECRSTGATTATCTWGSGHTTTSDFRGPITNGGSATCNGAWAGSVCFNDAALAQYSSGDTVYSVQSSNSANLGYFQVLTSAGAAAFSMGYAGSGYSDADYADKVFLASQSKLVSIGRGDDVASGTAAVEFRDNSNATGALLADIDGAGRIRPLVYGSQSNCSDGAGAAACSAAPAGSVVIDDGATTVVVSTTAVTANSQIIPVFDSSLGTKLGVTCNTTAVTPSISARVAGTSFTITAADPAGANPACFSYFIVN